MGDMRAYVWIDLFRCMLPLFGYFAVFSMLRPGVLPGETAYCRPELLHDVMKVGASHEHTSTSEGHRAGNFCRA